MFAITGYMIYCLSFLIENVSLAVEKEIQRWEFYSCIKFVPRVNSDQQDFVLFEPGDKYVGYTIAIL